MIQWLHLNLQAKSVFIQNVKRLINEQNTGKNQEVVSILREETVSKPIRSQIYSLQILKKSIEFYLNTNNVI